MGSNAERQARWRARRAVLVRSHPDVIERELERQAERFERLSSAERGRLADRLQDLAMGHFHRMHVLNKLAMKVRGGGVF